MMLGAQVSVSDWWLWNQIPVTLRNIVGGFICTGLALYMTHGSKVVAEVKPRGAAADVVAMGR
jgi:formate/nitrite transporter FocA (FNT family)